jgi:predicted ester cyclase
MKAFLFAALILFMAASCNNGTTSSSSTSDSLASARAAADSMMEKNKATALAGVEAFSKGDLDALVKDMATDAVDYGDGTGPVMKGADSVKAGAKMLMAAFPDFRGENFMALADGNHVAVFGDWTGTFKNAFMGMKPTGKSFKIKDVDLFTFNDAGKIIEHRNVQSFQTILDQVGAHMK